MSISKQAAPSVPNFLISVSAPSQVNRGNTFLVEVNVGNDGGAATDVTLTLSPSPGDAMKLAESNLDSFGFNQQPTFTVNVGGIGSPGVTSLTWAFRAEREGSVTLTVTARDRPSGATGSGAATLRILK